MSQFNFALITRSFATALVLVTAMVTQAQAQAPAPGGNQAYLQPDAQTDAQTGAQALAAASGPNIARFHLTPNPAFINCLAQYPGDPKRPPTAQVEVRRGTRNDQLTIELHNIKPRLAFDLFTVERSNLDAKGKPVSGFTNFGMAWYQTDLQANKEGEEEVSIRTILLDQIFGFDPDVNLKPTNTFQVGFWFNNPNDAAACGFNVAKPTPFNGEHKAGPLAMISLSNEKTGLGPLCLKPNETTSPATCNP